MQTLLQDLRYAFRTLRARPGFASTVALAVALGIGANTAIFSVVYGVLLQPLPYKDADRIVIAGISPPDYQDLKQSNRVFDRMAIWASNLYNVTVGGDTTQVLGAVVSPEFFPILGDPLIGRTWQLEEDPDHLIVISHDFWKSRFGGDPTVLGESLSLHGEPFTIIGVMPPNFQYPTGEFKLWTTLGPAMARTPRQMENRQFRIFRAVAHLRPGVTLPQMRAEIDTISQHLQQQYPDTNAGVTIAFEPLYERIVGDVRPAMLVLLGTVGLVLLIACANVANLMLARTSDRDREIAIRIALGASRRRVMRLILTESLVLAAAGGAAGLLLGVWVIDLLAIVDPDDIPRVTSIGLNLPVLLFTIGATILTGVLVGTIPAWHAARGAFNQSLKEGGRGTVNTVKARRMRGGLVVTEVMLSVIVLIGAGLLTRSFLQLLRVDLGFVAENLLTVDVGFVQFQSPERRTALHREIIDRVKQIPGVEAVGAGTGLPPSTPQRGTRFEVLGLPDKSPDETSGYFIAVSHDHFRTLGTPMIAGREFTPRDESGSAGVAIISHSLARRLFPNERAVGKQLRLVNPEQPGEWREIVGVADDIRYGGLADDYAQTIYTPFAQTPFIWTYLIIRTSVAPRSLIHSVRQAVTSTDPELEAGSFKTMDQLISVSVAKPRFYMLLIGSFALLALMLASVGVYAVIAYSAAQRTNEIGIRMALGARPGDVIRMIIKQGMGLAVIGVIAGLAASAGLTKLMAALLFGVSTTDLETFVTTAALVTLVALLASYLPARRAAKVDPILALRHD